MAREQVEVRAKEQVLTLLGTATSKLREKLGESLALDPAIRRCRSRRRPPRRSTRCTPTRWRSIRAG